jgi:hypothetical protein
MPKVTVLMAVYNGERFVREAIDSILSQTFQDFEFLIVDDGSTDRSREVILSYNDPRIRLLTNERNLGLTASLNRGLAEARGTYVARHDADDISEPTRLERQVACLDARADLALLGTWYRKIGEHGEFLGKRRLPVDHVRARWCLLFFCPFVHASVMLRRSLILERVGPYDESFAYAQDYDLWSRTAELLPVANLPEYLVRIRTSASQMTATYGERLLEGPRISIAHVAPLLGWNPAEMDRNMAAFANMHALLYGAHERLRPLDVSEATTEILRLVPAFVNKTALAPREARRLAAAVRARLGSRLLEMSGRFSDEEFAEVGAQLGPGPLRPVLQLMAHRPVRTLFNALHGPGVVRMMRERQPM